MREIFALDFDGDSPPPPLVVICPFDVTKGADESPAWLGRKRAGPVAVACAVPGECVIRGEGEHVKVRGSEAETALIGFRFEGSDDTSYRIWNDTPRRQLLCHTEFIG